MPRCAALCCAALRCAARHGNHPKRLPLLCNWQWAGCCARNGRHLVTSRRHLLALLRSFGAPLLPSVSKPLAPLVSSHEPRTNLCPILCSHPFLFFLLAQISHSPSQLTDTGASAVGYKRSLLSLGGDLPWSNRLAASSRPGKKFDPITRHGGVPTAPILWHWNGMCLLAP